MAPRTGARFKIRVKRVVDGDSLVLRRAGILGWVFGSFTARLYAIDAPEASQPYGREATEGLRKLVARHKPLGIHVRAVDHYGRSVVVVYPRRRGEQASLNTEMVRLGHAYWYRRYGGGKLGMAQAESSARESRRGVWADGGGERPWDYRTRQRQSAGWGVALLRLLVRGVSGLFRLLLGRRKKAPARMRRR